MKRRHELRNKNPNESKTLKLAGFDTFSSILPGNQCLIIWVKTLAILTMRLHDRLLTRPQREHIRHLLYE
ncbi:hypothetical protein EUGRSUZ_K02870 [Eucalyptus grandis]|uniref:Uncharacterized protein n=2 Tax=Eucalyptus grandis TaxID=71139 RepID=A0ACC3IYB0_EUCGR|nr:hypothetical protein EUGRSUZ_K02870 [Eucalyptus grandis]